MNIDGLLIEQIVQGVLKQLAPAAPGVRTQAGDEKNIVQPPFTDSTGQLFDQPVITEALLQERLNGQGRIVVGAKTIVTPAAHEFLKARRVVWTRQCASPAGNAAEGRWRAVVVETTPAVASVLEAAGRLTGVEWKRETAGAADEAAVNAAEALNRAEADSVVVFAQSAERIACRANRHSAVRAGVAHDMQSLIKLKTELGVNLLCIQPGDKSFFELRNLLRMFVQDGPPRKPADWEE